MDGARSRVRRDGDHDGQLSFAPRLLNRLSRLAFSVLWQGHRLRATISRTEATYSLRNGHGAPVRLLHHGQPLTPPPGSP